MAHPHRSPWVTAGLRRALPALRFTVHPHTGPPGPPECRHSTRAARPPRLSLRDIAPEVNLTPGYLTTVVRRRTGRTVLEWFAERGIAEARRLLVEIDRSAEVIARAVGYDDTGYFIRVFRRVHAVTRRGGARWLIAAM